MSDDTKYIESTTDGYYWRLYTYKPQGRPAYAFATEGKVGFRDNGTVESFETVMFQDRTARVDIPGRLTEKARTAGMKALYEKLVAEGNVSPDAELKSWY
jgi:hypothetical protein